MTTYRLVIQIDDDDREQDTEDMPWTATLNDSESTGFESDGGGVGRDPIAALQMLVDEFLERAPHDTEEDDK